MKRIYYILCEYLKFKVACTSNFGQNTRTIIYLPNSGNRDCSSTNDKEQHAEGDRIYQILNRKNMQFLVFTIK